MPKQMLMDYFSNDDTFRDKINEIFKSNCAENNCKLKGDLRDYIILDGDSIKDCMNVDNVKSVDCILIKETSDCEINILLCELDAGNSGKSVTYVRDKMRGSGEFIFDLFNEKGFKINSFKCLYLGRYKPKNHKPALSRVNINGFPSYDIMIVNKSCGFTLKDSFF